MSGQRRNESIDCTLYIAQDIFINLISAGTK